VPRKVSLIESSSADATFGRDRALKTTATSTTEYIRIAIINTSIYRPDLTHQNTPAGEAMDHIGMVNACQILAVAASQWRPVAFTGF
jgi:hypothetical protein